MTQRNRSHDWHGKVQEEEPIGAQEGPESYHLLQVQGVRALPQQLPKEETSILVGSNMF